MGCGTRFRRQSGVAERALREMQTRTGMKFSVTKPAPMRLRCGKAAQVRGLPAISCLMERQRVRLCRWNVWKTDGPPPCQDWTVRAHGYSAPENMEHNVWRGSRELGDHRHDGRRTARCKLWARCPIWLRIGHARWCNACKLADRVGVLLGLKPMVRAAPILRSGKSVQFSVPLFKLFQV